MRVEQLRIDGLRNLREVTLDPAPGLNLLIGSNGAGKTSVLESLHLLAHGRSFRTAQLDSLTRHGTAEFSVFVRLDTQSVPRSLGMMRSHTSWQLAHDGQSVATVLEFVKALAVVSMEPECHALITGPSEARRRYLDWLLFHMEPAFLTAWRRYLRALRQRNAALRAGLPERSVAAWEPEIAEAGEVITQCREIIMAPIDEVGRRMLVDLNGALPPFELRFRRGWPAGWSLADALEEGRQGDRERGFTQRGPHRADWRLHFEGELDQRQLSRGQAKLVALSCLVAQAEVYRSKTDRWPIFIFDDLASELDADRQTAVLAWANQTEAQVFLSGTSAPVGWAERGTVNTRMFHVEQGQVRPLV